MVMIAKRQSEIKNYCKLLVFFSGHNIRLEWNNNTSNSNNITNSLLEEE